MSHYLTSVPDGCRCAYTEQRIPGEPHIPPYLDSEPNPECRVHFPFQKGDRVRIGKGKKVWILRGRACSDPCEHWDATVEGSEGYTNQMVEAGRLSLVKS